MSDDLISRQLATDTLKDLTANGTNKGMISGEDAVHRIEMLPPAHPEPCEDAVSREEVLNCLEWQYPDKTPRTKIMELPPVTPKQRTGKWIVPSQVPDMVRGYWAKCSACGHSTFGGGKFCGECGAKMEGVSNESD